MVSFLPFIGLIFEFLLSAGFVLSVRFTHFWIAAESFLPSFYRAYFRIPTLGSYWTVGKIHPLLNSNREVCFLPFIELIFEFLLSAAIGLSVSFTHFWKATERFYFLPSIVFIFEFLLSAAIGLSVRFNHFWIATERSFPSVYRSYFRIPTLGRVWTVGKVHPRSNSCREVSFLPFIELIFEFLLSAAIGLGVWK